MPSLQADEIFVCLDRHRVLYVVVGGLAAVLHGSPLPTVDVDVCPSREPPNLDRLAVALAELDARIRTPDSPEGVSFPHEGAFLANVELLNLVTLYGDLDLTFRPAGTEGFADLARRAEKVMIRGVGVSVAALEDVIRSKEAADRPKDRRSLPVLRQLLDEIQRRRNRSGT
jgi:hypothetical protein